MYAWITKVKRKSIECVEGDGYRQFIHVSPLYSTETMFPHGYQLSSMQGGITSSRILQTHQGWLCFGHQICSLIDQAKSM